MRLAATKLRHGHLKRPAALVASLKAVAESLSLSSIEEAIVFVAVFDRQCGGAATTIEDLSSYYDCSTLEVVEFTPHIKTLRERGLMSLDNPSEHMVMEQSFKISIDIMNMIIEGREVSISPIQPRREFDQFDFCKVVHSLIEKRSNNTILTSMLMKQIEEMEDEHSSLPLIEKAKSQLMDIADRCLLYEVCNDFIQDSDGGNTTISSTLKDIYDHYMDSVKVKRQLLDLIHPLLTSNLVDLTDDDELRLSSPGIEILFGDEASLYAKGYANLDRYTFVNNLYREINDNDMSMSTRKQWSLLRILARYEKANPQLNFITTLSHLIRDKEDRLLFYMICRELINNDQYVMWQLNELYPKEEEMKVQRRLKNGLHPLVMYGLVTVEKDSMFDRAILKLTDKALDLYLESDASLFQSAVQDCDIIQPDTIGGKNLFFEPILQQQLSTLQESLQEKAYDALCRRLAEKNLPTGVAVLLYGEPGTGKTESVMQLARATGRKIYHVDISKTKSCWFGESEKIIKEVFENYRKLCKKCSRRPILLFNEADAVFSKRKDVNHSNVAQTENAIQNILLEEMERLDGILIATTNLATNLDAAFERRFLFKIRFERPTSEVKSRIWIDKLPTLQPSEALQLSQSYDFSGGEIDNIVRKATLEEVITGTLPSLPRILELCSQEKLASTSSHRRLGFA